MKQIVAGIVLALVLAGCSKGPDTYDWSVDPVDTTDQCFLIEKGTTKDTGAGSEYTVEPLGIYCRQK